MSSESIASQIQQAHKRLLDVIQGEADLRKKLKETLDAQENTLSAELDSVEKKEETIKREQERIRNQLLELPDTQRIDVRLLLYYTLFSNKSHQLI